MRPIEAALKAFKQQAIELAAGAIADTICTEPHEHTGEIAKAMQVSVLQKIGEILKDSTEVSNMEHDLVVGELIALTRDERLKLPEIITVCREILKVHSRQPA
jgi:hypothetical protein